MGVRVVGAYYTEIRAQVGELDQLDWDAISASDFRQPQVKESKQAEFLIEGSFPFQLVDRIGVLSPSLGTRATAVIENAAHKPAVEVCPQWYFSGGGHADDQLHVW
jgi:hypothetical protein